MSRNRHGLPSFVTCVTARLFIPNQRRLYCKQVSITSGPSARLTTGRIRAKSPPSWAVAIPNNLLGSFRPCIKTVNSFTVVSVLHSQCVYPRCQKNPLSRLDGLISARQDYALIEAGLKFRHKLVLRQDAVLLIHT